MARWQPRMWVVGAVLLGIRLCAQEAEQEPLPVSWSYRSESFPIVAREQVATIVLPVPNVDSVLAEERRLDSLGVIRPYRFGIAIPVEVDVKEQGTVELLEDGRYLIRLRFVCPGAKTLNVGVKRYRFAEGTQLFVYGTFPYRPGYRSFAVGWTLSAVSLVEGRTVLDLASGGGADMDRMCGAHGGDGRACARA
jgi:hypothetical protein